MDPLILAAAGLLAGFIDSIIGGGGVVSLPALLATGMPPHAAVATNKVVGTGASTIATINYARAGLLRRSVWALVPLAAAASALGAFAILRIEGRHIVTAVMVVVASLVIYILARPAFGREDRTRLDGRALLGLAAAALLLGFYDGLLGPGTGNLLLVAFVALAGMPMLAAAAHGRLVNWGSNVGALAFWLTTGLIQGGPGLVMAGGTVVGGWLGSRSTIRTEARWVRPLFVVVAVALLVRMAFS